MTKIEELLNVLDLSEEEQYEFVIIHSKKDSITDIKFFTKEFRNMSLAELAFRLRDEAERTEFHNGIYEVQKRLKKEDWATAYWGEIFARPIDWIIAALISKELSKASESKNNARPQPI